MDFRKLFIILFAFLLFQSVLHSEDVIVVSAGKIEQKLEKAVEHIQVVSEKDIKASGAKTLTEAVKNLPCVVVNGAGPANPTDSISMQGFDSAYVKILVDGIAVSGDIAGSAPAFQIPVEDIDHIEVIQGASSALYGSDAMGGVINIITKKTVSSQDKIKFGAALAEEFSCSIIGDIRNYSTISANLAGKKLNAQVSGSFDFSPAVRKKSYDALAGSNIEYYETPKKMLGFARTTLNWQDI